MRLTEVVEMAVGAAILKGLTRIGAYVARAWLAAITANLISSRKHFDVAARDANLAVAAFMLARLCEREEASQLREPEQLARAAWISPKSREAYVNGPQPSNLHLCY